MSISDPVHIRNFILKFRKSDLISCCYTVQHFQSWQSFRSTSYLTCNMKLVKLARIQEFSSGGGGGGPGQSDKKSSDNMKSSAYFTEV